MKTVIYKAIIIIAVTLSITIVNQPVTATDVGGIIDTDTTWPLAGSPYIVTQTVQVASGVTLTISPGVVVARGPNSNSIQFWGSFYAVGTDSDNITFDRISLERKSSDITMQIEFALLSTSHLTGTNLTLQNSTIQEGSQIYLRGGTCYVERNIFYEAEVIIQNYPGPNIIRNNVFYLQDLSSECLLLDSYTSDTTIEFNSFLNTEKIAIRLSPGDVAKEIPASQNFWNTTETSVIDSMIYDKYDDLIISGSLNYLPILTTPHPNTPIFDPYNMPPQANAGPDQIVFDEITLDGSLSDDPDGEITSYQWQLVHRVNSAYNRSAEGETPTVSDLKYGFYDVTLIIEDSEGSSDADQMSFSATGLKGDFNFDGNVDGSDLAEFAEKFGTSE